MGIPLAFHQTLGAFPIYPFFYCFFYDLRPTSNCESGLHHKFFGLQCRTSVYFHTIVSSQQNHPLPTPSSNAPMASKGTMAPCLSTKKGSFLPLDDVLRVYIYSAEVMEVPFDKMAVNNLIANMKHEKLSDDNIYDAMTELFPNSWLSCLVV